MARRALDVGGEHVARPRMASRYEPDGAVGAVLPLEQALEVERRPAAPLPERPPAAAPTSTVVHRLEQIVQQLPAASPSATPAPVAHTTVTTEDRDPDPPPRRREEEPVARVPPASPEVARAWVPDVVPAVHAVVREPAASRGDVRLQRDAFEGAPHPEASAPLVRVSIGRIDVRAVMPPAPPARRVDTGRPPAGQSLEEYLRGGRPRRAGS